MSEIIILNLFSLRRNWSEKGSGRSFKRKQPNQAERRNTERRGSRSPNRAGFSEDKTQAHRLRCSKGRQQF